MKARDLRDEKPRGTMVRRIKEGKFNDTILSAEISLETFITGYNTLLKMKSR